MKNEAVPCIALAGLETVSQSWQGQVHSLFDRAVNVAVGPSLFTLISNPLWISEKNIVLPGETLARARPSSIIRFDKPRLFIDGLAVGHCKGTTLWRMPQLVFSPLADLSLVADCLENSPPTGFLLNIDAEFTAAARCFLDGREADFSSVVGAGNGLTPSGDDMLVGLALALLYAAPARLKQLAECCRPLLPRTTDISRYLLAEALDGKFSVPLVNLLLALQNNEAIGPALETAWNIGGSSGRDGIFGLYCGLTYFSRR